MAAAVLIVSTALDQATDAVEEDLIQRGVPVVRFNSETYPFDSTLTYRLSSGEPLEFSLNKKSVFRSIWYRRTRPAPQPDGMEAGHFAFSEKESRFALVGSVLALSQTLPIMSPPAAVWAAEHKPYQLAIARQCGLRVPDTLVSNEPYEAEKFFRCYRPDVIAKSVRTGYLEDATGPKAIFTSKVEESHMERISRLTVAPAMFQPLLHKKSDIRVTVVGERILSAEICSQSDKDASIDWRRTSNPDLPHKVHVLPHRVEQCLLKYMQCLGLHYGAIDLVLDEEGDYWFLEINPGGQWLWLDRILSLGITKCIAHWLESCGSPK